MVTPSENLVTNLLNLGAYDIILFAFFAALFYAVLRKTKILGDSPVLLGVISLGLSFLIFGFPVITGAGSLLFNFTTFFTQIGVIGVVFLVAFLLASFFYPNMPEMLAKSFTHRSALVAMIALVIVLFLTSGLVQVFWQATLSPPSNSISSKAAPIPQNILLFVAGISIFMIMIIIAAYVVREE